jgi:hypothetical protein
MTAKNGGENSHKTRSITFKNALVIMGLKQWFF